MKNADNLAFPIEINGFGQYAPEVHGGLTKREMFAMHAPDVPKWFIEKLKARNDVAMMYNPATGRDDKLSPSDQERLYFEWRHYFAAEMLK